MQKILHTVFINILAVFKNYLLLAVLITFAAAVIILCSILIAAAIKKENAASALKRSAVSVIGVLVPVFYVSTILNATVIFRLSLPEHDPFSMITGGWTIVETTFYYDFSALWNIIAFLPVCTIIFIFAKATLKRDLNIKTFLVCSVTAGFLISAIIESLQILLKAGTFQNSDLVYNTLGAALSVPVFILLKTAAVKISKQIKKRKQKKV